jgi:putative spermidine/putrescine transport system substrate-binding protein
MSRSAIRNSVVVVAVVALGLALFVLWPSRPLTVVSYGAGAYQDSHIEAFEKPFGLKSGVQVASVTWRAEYNKLSEMVTSGKVTWDVVDVTAAQFSRGMADGLFAKLTVLPTEGKFLKGAVSDYGVGNVYWATGIAFKPSRYGNAPPSTWADFWDVKKFPGTRALYDDPRANIEFALLASGVPKADLYPLTDQKIDIAFNKLEELRPYVRVWWSDGSQPLQLLLNDSVTLSSIWNGRVFASPQGRKELTFAWDGAALELDYWIIPRGSPKVDLASQFVFFASQPSTMAKQAELIGYGPVNVAALDALPIEVRRQLPTYPTNFEASFVVDAGNWQKREDQLRARWLQFKAKSPQ